MRSFLYDYDAEVDARVNNFARKFIFANSLGLTNLLDTLTKYKISLSDFTRIHARKLKLNSI